jgi:hypothetical protein
MTVRKTKILFFIICILQLFYLFNFRSGFRYEIIKDPFNENSGIKHAVSKEVIESKKILKRNKIVHFNLSKSLKEDTYFYQRSIEFNYPTRINQSSKLVFFSINEDISEKCKIIKTGKYLKLTQC